MKRLTNKEYAAEKIAAHYFRELEIENVRCFGGKQKLNLADDAGKPYHWTIILGENGTGKSSLLKALVAVAPSPKAIGRDTQSLRLYPGLLDWSDTFDLRRMTTSLTAVLRARTVAAHSINRPEKKELILEVRQFPTGSPRIDVSEETYGQLGDFLCFAYGASRRMGKATLSDDKLQRASATLFEDDAALINVEEFFLRADYEAKTSRSRRSLEERNRVKELLVGILPDVSDLRIGKSRQSGRGVEAKTSFGWIRLNELSLGYKSLIAWVVDFASRMYHYHRTKKNPFHAPAVVLVDEIDLHMHPAWQRRILSYLSKRFPNTQFIATAHSPLIVQAAAGANLILLKKRGSSVRINSAPEIIKEWRVDQILTSDIFGLSSSRSVETEQLLNERRKLLLGANPTRGDKDRMEQIEGQLSSIPVAETPEYIKAMEIVQRVSRKV